MAAPTHYTHNDLSLAEAIPQNALEAFDERLHTFTNWHYNGRLAPVHMAAAGFYQHSGSSDAVSCFCCQIRMEGWHEQSDPIEEHQRASPSCTWNNGTYMQTLEERLGSFYSWPIDIKPLPITMAAAGFYHSNKNADGVTCFSCKLALRDWKKDDDPIKLHTEHSSLYQPCQWILKVTHQPDQYVPSDPPLANSIADTKRKPRTCGVCHKTFPSGNQFHKHRLKAHRLVRGRVGASLHRPAILKRSGATFMGKHRVSKAQRPR